MISIVRIGLAFDILCGTIIMACILLYCRHRCACSNDQSNNEPVMNNNEPVMNNESATNIVVGIDVTGLSFPNVYNGKVVD